MDHKLIFFAALFLLSVLLFAGLPESDSHPTSNDQESTDSSTVQGHQTDATGAAIARLREEQARLQREIKLLKTKLDGPSGMTQKAGHQSQVCDGTQDAEEPSGVTVYLETSSVPSSDRDPQWTAVSYRDVGTAPGGSRQAVLSIHQTRPPTTSVVSASPVQKTGWQ